VSDIELRDGATALTVSPGSGGRWAALRVDDLELIGRGGDRLVDWGNFPMAPFAGRIRRGRLEWAGRRHQLPIGLPPHAIHGVTLDRPWQVLDHSAREVALRCDFDNRWPWPGHVVQHVHLDADRVRASLEVHADDAPMPAWTGYHPWFSRLLARGEPARLEITSAGVLPRDEDGMPLPDVAPVPPPPWDDCFVDVTWPARVIWDGALTLEISSDAPHAVVFDEKPGAVCIEPQTAPPNAAELGMAATVEPGRPLTIAMQLTWK